MISWKKVMSILLAAALLLSGTGMPLVQETYAAAKTRKTTSKMNLRKKMITYSVDEVPAGYTAIRTIDDLYAIRNNLSGKYILMNDIDLSQATARAVHMIPETAGRLFREIRKNLLKAFLMGMVIILRECIYIVKVRKVQGLLTWDYLVMELHLLLKI